VPYEYEYEYLLPYDTVPYDTGVYWRYW